MQGIAGDVAKRDIKGVVDFAYLEDFAAGEDEVIDEVLALFREQSAIWGAMLSADQEGWRDAVHTLKGSSRGIGAFAVGEACARCEINGAGGLGAVRDALDEALGDIAAYQHERALKSLKAPGG